MRTLNYITSSLLIAVLAVNAHLIFIKMTGSTEAFRLKYERAFYPVVKKELKNQLIIYTSSLANVGPQATLQRLGADMLTSKLTGVITTIYTTVGVASANKTLKELKRIPILQKRASIGYNEEWTQQVIDYFNEHLFNKVVLPIEETTRDYISNIIKQGIDEGWSIERMTQEIEREDYLDGRVRRILRTETNRAINYGSLIGEDKYSFTTLKKWVAVHDDRTRHWHLSADGQTVNPNQSFTVEGQPMMFPGDPNGSAENTINCRCHMAFVPMRDKNGRLIPKTPQGQVRIVGSLMDELLNALT
jgi:uncharacterized protein with gpF-like domain